MLSSCISFSLLNVILCTKMVVDEDSIEVKMNNAILLTLRPFDRV